MKIKQSLNKAGIALVNGLNVSNPDHVPFESNYSQERLKRQLSDEEILGKMTMTTGGVIAVGAVALEVIGVGPDTLMDIGAYMGLGGVAVGAAVYGMSRVSNR